MKSILTRSDLAVNGAAPCFPEPLHVGRPNLGDREAFLRAAAEVYDSRWLTNDGPRVRELERRIAAALDVAHCVAMANGTVALEIAIRALGLTGEVIIPSYTFIATAHALHWQAITPVFADIDPRTHNLDPESVRKCITPRTSGIIGVHLWGRGADVDGLAAIAEEHRLQLMFDSAHAFGCSHGQRLIGGFGRAEVLSFHATKAFNTFEGGAVVTNDDALAHTLRLMRNFGFSGFDNVIHPGTNGKMTEICAAMGLVNLDALPATIARNRENYLAYQQAFEDLPGVTLLRYDERERNNFHYIVAEIDPACGTTRDQVVAALHAENILARKYFWPGCHRMLPYRDLFPWASLRLTNTEAISDRVVVLPNGDLLPEQAPHAIASVIRALAST